MTPPPLHVRALGHATVVLPTTGLFLFSLYMLSQDMRTWPAALVFGLTLNKVMQANAASEAYKTWKRGWDAMAPDNGPPSAKPGRVVAMMAVAALLWAMYAYPLLVAACVGYALGWLSLRPWLLAVPGFVIVALLLRLVRRWSRRRRRSATQVMPVTICVSRPLLPVPDLQSAYRRLPEHCARILHSTS